MERQEVSGAYMQRDIGQKSCICVQIELRIQRENNDWLTKRQTL